MSEPDPRAGSGATHAELDEFLARAVDRQIAEQRALRETLAELSERIQALEPGRGSLAPEVEDFGERLGRWVEETSTTVVAEIREMRDTLMPAIQRAFEHAGRTAPATLETDMVTLREAVGSTASDVEGIAQALIDLNAGLRDWADGVGRHVLSLRDAIEQVRAIAVQVHGMGGETLDAIAYLQQAPPPQVDVAVAEVVQEPPPQPMVEPEPAEERAELSLYLTDQIKDIDRAVQGMGDLPSRLEAVVSQAVRRMLAARAKLDSEAEGALDEALAVIDEQVTTVADSAASMTAGEEELRRIAEGNDEISARLDAVQAELIDKLETIETERRRTEEVLAAAIDAVASGRDPRARERMRAVVRPPTRAKSGAKKSGAKKAKATKAKRRGAAKGGAHRRGRSQRTTPQPASDQADPAADE